MRSLMAAGRFKGLSCDHLVCLSNTHSDHHPPNFLMSTLILILSQPDRSSVCAFSTCGDVPTLRLVLTESGGGYQTGVIFLTYVYVDINISWGYTVDQDGGLALSRPMRTQ